MHTYDVQDDETPLQASTLTTNIQPVDATITQKAIEGKSCPKPVIHIRAAKSHS